MGVKTAIEYADSTVNPIMGCSGCELYNPVQSKNHCYAATLCKRYAGANKGFPANFNHPQHFPSRLEKAIGWKDLTGTDRLNKPWLNGYPRIVFVNDLSDGFCKDVDPSGWLGPCLHKMSQSPHIWLLLTKWPRAMGYFFPDGAPENFWLGTSVLRQRDEERIKELLRIKAAVHWLSVEPLLESLNIEEYLTDCTECGNRGSVGLEVGYNGYATSLCRRACPKGGEGPAINWVTLGGESGPGARPMHPAWAIDIRDQCQSADVPYFFKQHGAWLPAFDCFQKGLLGIGKVYQPHKWNDDSTSFCIGKKRAGRLLDGKTWNEMPALP